MFISQEISIRILSSSIAVLLGAALIFSHRRFWPDFLVGMALGLSIGLAAVAWSKQTGEEDPADKREPVELGISK